METPMARAIWYADGLRWIGSIFNDAAERLEKSVADEEPLDPGAYREIERYVNDLHRRVHVHF